MDPCAERLGRDVLPHCENHQHPTRCCATLQRPVGCSPHWAHAFSVHASRARTRYRCDERRAGVASDSATTWCDECRYAPCEGVAWRGEMTPACADAMMRHCGDSSDEECVWWRAALATCGDATPKWRECSTRVRGLETSVVDVARTNRQAARFRVVRLSAEAWEFTETFGCGAHACVPVIAARVDSNSTDLLARAAFGYADVPLATVTTAELVHCWVSLGLVVLVALVLLLVDAEVVRHRHRRNHSSWLADCLRAL